MIREYLPSDASLKGGKQKLAGQYIAILTKKSGVYKGVLPQAADRSGDVQRSFAPGSEWIYLKIYCTNESADHLLTTFIQPFISANSAKISKWFFVRYYDPEPHLRLRLLSTTKAYGPLIRSFRREVLRSPVSQLVRHLSLETYQREIERYGPETMALAEAVFWRGSIVAVNQLTAVAPEKNGLSLYAFRLVHEMTKCFVSDRALHAAFYRERFQSFLAEFGDQKAFRLSLDRKYRGLSKQIAAEIQTGFDPGQQTGEQALYQVLVNIAGQTGAWPADRRLRLLADLIHMQVNRLFSSRQRQHEALLFFCLAKYAASALAR